MVIVDGVLFLILFLFLFLFLFTHDFFDFERGPPVYASTLYPLKK